VDDDDSECKKSAKHKPKLVILGTGWGAVAMLKSLKPEDYRPVINSCLRRCYRVRRWARWSLEVWWNRLERLCPRFMATS
jgi:hypothetical protein